MTTDANAPRVEAALDVRWPNKEWRNFLPQDKARERREMAAILSAADTDGQVVSEWQPIETAPMDRWFLAGWPGNRWRYPIAMRRHGEYFSSTWGFPSKREQKNPPTRYMELPPPPPETTP